MSNVFQERVAFETIKNITLEHADVINLRKEFDFTLSILSSALDELDQLREQKRPPTFDEVVKAWKVLGYELYEHCVYFIGDVNCRFENKGTIIYLSNDGIEIVFEDKNFKLSNEELKTINLTIRYLESQKEQENG